MLFDPIEGVGGGQEEMIGYDSGELGLQEISLGG